MSKLRANSIQHNDSTSVNLDLNADGSANLSDGAALLGGIGVTRVEKLTQSAYNALDPPDADTLYIIID